ncbi:MAG: Translation initiation factor IF-1 [Parcubacteria group bacterium GW2011_GWB1_44_7]|nr:MAG: Translation initiation factor IF-1 [Parcubacteria group bacterium GW2011_GWB1_44_7]
MEKSKDKEVYAFGIVTEALPNALFRVELETSKKTIIAYLAGKMRLHRIRVLVGDKVKIVVDNYGEKGRIVQRL